MIEKAKHLRAELSRSDHSNFRIEAAKRGISMFQLATDLVRMIARREVDTTIILNDNSFNRLLVKINSMLTNGAVITEREGVEALIAMLTDGDIDKSVFIKKVNDIKFSNEEAK